MLKKIAAVLLIVAFVLCCGCGGPDAENGTSSTVNSMPTESDTSSENTEREIKDMLNITVKAYDRDKFSSGRPYDSKKEDISIILVVGQSNFTTSVGYSAELGALQSGKTDNVPHEPVIPQQGIAYSFGTSSGAFDLVPGRDMNKLCNPVNGTATLGGVTPSFAIQWNALTGTKVVFVQAAVGAVGVHEWTPDPSKYSCTCSNNGKGELYAKATTAYMNAYNTLSAKYNIVYTGYIWNQGEHDEVYGKKPGVTVCDAESYYDAYMEMHNGFMETLKLDFGGISVVRADQGVDRSTASGSNSYTIARAAQYKLCADVDNLFMLSTISETCSHPMMDQGNHIHYSQMVFNLMGAEMANTLFNELGIGDEAEYTGVKIYSADGKTICAFDKDGKLTSGSDIITRAVAGDHIIVRLDSLGTAHKLEYKLSLDGEDGSRYLSDFGDFDWVNLSGKGVKEIKVNVIAQ